MLEIYNNEYILSAQGIEVGNLNYATFYANGSWNHYLQESSLFRIVNSQKV